MLGLSLALSLANVIFGHVPGSGGVGTNNLLLESGDDFQLETSDPRDVILLEA